MQRGHAGSSVSSERDEVASFFDLSVGFGAWAWRRRPRTPPPLHSAQARQAPKRTHATPPLMPAPVSLDSWLDLSAVDRAVILKEMKDDKLISKEDVRKLEIHRERLQEEDAVQCGACRRG